MNADFPDANVLRGYASSWLDAMFRLDEVCFAGPFRFTRADMRRFAEARRAQVVLAVREEVLAGFSIVHVERDGGQSVGYLLTLDIDPAFRRRGLAQRLMCAVEEQASSAGCEAMLLHVFTANEAAIGLYEKLGYARVGVEKDFYRRGLSAWVYRKVLS